MEELASDILTTHLARTSNVVLAIEPISRAVTRAVAAISNTQQIPMLLCPDTNTVDNACQGTWNTADFARFVTALDHGKFCILARRNGGSPAAQGGPVTSDSIERVKQSLSTDIEAGFGIIHFAPSFGREAPLDQNAAMQLQLEMLEHCSTEAQRLGKSLRYEIGEGQRQVDDEDQLAFNQMITATGEACIARGLPQPSFAEGKTGTFIAGHQNRGSLLFDNPTADLLPASMQIPRIAMRCKQLGLRLSTSQCDYLPDASLSMFSTLGIQKATFGPEFGTAEARRIVQLCAYTRRQDLVDRFYSLALHRSKKVVSEELSPEQREEAIHAGSKIFHTEAYADIHLELETACAKRGLDLNHTLEQMHRIRILRLIRALRITSVSLAANAKLSTTETADHEPAIPAAVPATVVETAEKTVGATAVATVSATD